MTITFHYAAMRCALLLALLLEINAAARAQVPTSQDAPPVASPRPGLVLEAPFHSDHNWIILDGRFGRDFESAQKAPVLHLLLDTGASNSVLSQESVESHKLSFEASIETPKKVHVKASGDSDDKLLIRRVKATLSLTDSSGGTNNALEYTPEIPLSITPFGEKFRRLGIDGLIGDDLLRFLVVEVDYEKRVVRFYDPAAFRPPPADEPFTEVPLSFRKNDGLPFITTEITPYGFNAATVKLALDTGSDTTLLMHAPFVARHHWQNVLPTSVPSQVFGINGNSNTYSARLHDIRFGETELNSAPVMFSVSKLGAMATTESDGTLGGAIFKRFTIILDLPHSRIFVLPNSAASQPFPISWYFGIIMIVPARADGGYALQTVLPGSPAARAGMKAGDVIYGIDGKKATDIGDDNLALISEDGIQTRTFDVATVDGGVHRQVRLIGVAY